MNSFEVRFDVSESAIHGTLAYPGFSLNNRLYFPEELERAHGRRLNIYDQHSDMFEIDPMTGKPLMRNGMPVPRQGPPPPPDGWMDVRFDTTTKMLLFDGEITNSAVKKLIDEGLRKFVSLRLDPERYDVIRGPWGKNYLAPIGGQFVSAATTDNPGIPVSMISAESAQQPAYEEFCGDLKVVRQQPRLPDRFDRERLIEVYRYYGMPGLSAQLRKVYGLPNLPGLTTMDFPELLKIHNCAAESFSQAGLMIFDNAAQVEPFIFWHEVAHVIETATGAEKDEDWCSKFATVMTGEQVTKLALIGGETKK